MCGEFYYYASVPVQTSRFNEMETSLSQLATEFLVYFFLVGHSSFDPNIEQQKKFHFCSMFRTYFPSFIFLVLVCCSTILSFRNMNFDDVTFDSAIYCLMVASSFATCAIVFAHTPIFGDRSSIMWTTFIRFEEFTKNILNMKFDFDEFRTSFISKVKTMTFLYVLMLLMKFTTRSSVDTFVRHFAMLALNLTSTAATLHILFYVDLFGYMMYFVNQNIVISYRDVLVSTMTLDQSQKLTKLLRNIKRIHYKLWGISHLISNKHGWLLVSLIVLNINYTVHPIYMFIVNLDENKFSPNKRVLSKYKQFLFIYFDFA